MSKKVEVLPYHTMGVRKYKEMGIKYRLEGVEPPTADRIENAEKLLCVADYKGYLTWKPGINTKGARALSRYLRKAEVIMVSAFLIAK